MSDSENDSEGDKIRRRTKRSVIVKFKFDDTSSSSESEGPCMRPSTSKKIRKLSSSDSSSNDDENNIKKKQSDRQFYHRNKLYLLADNDSSDDDSWCPESENRPSTSQTGTNNNPNITNVAEPTIANQMQSESSDSDSSDMLIEKCPICLHSFREQEIGMPNVCEHSFCVPCIEEWSNNVQTCPIDRQPFTSIRIRSRYADGNFIREIPVEAKATELKNEFDYTNCEVCHMSDREETMLLCDSCNGGYHMECLVPRLTEIPAGSWYCDNCFESESSDEDEASLLAELQAEIGIAETRLRVHRAILPVQQIPRTRQSERIRTTIRNRRRDVSTVNGDPSVPGPSRVTTTTTMMTTFSRTKSTVACRKTRKPKRRRRVARKRRTKTYVVEYDVDNYDNKFSIKSTKKVIRRRRKKVKRKSRKCASRKSAKSNAAEMSVAKTARGIKEMYPKLHLFGDRNALEYFPDDSENDEGIDLNNSIENSDGLLVMRSLRPSIGLSRGLIRQKNGLMVPDNFISTETNVLGSIMDSMDQMRTTSLSTAVSGNVTANNDSQISHPKISTNSSTKIPNSTIVQAPMYPRNANDGNRNSGNFTNSNGYRGNPNTGNGDTYSNVSLNRGNHGFSNSFSSNNSNGNNDGGEHFTGSGSDFSSIRQPFRQRDSFGNNRLNQTINRLTAMNQSQSQSQGLYDGEDIAPPQPVDQAIALKDPERDDNIPVAISNTSDTVNERNNTFVENNSTTTKQPTDDSDSEADPEFEYSAESIAAAIVDDNENAEQQQQEKSEENKETSEQNENNMENDEDLVQLDDDDAFAENEIENREANTSNEQDENNSTTSNTNAEPDKKESDSNENPDRSFTPCLDEQHQEEAASAQTSSSDETNRKNEKNRSVTGIEGMDTELISEDENDNLLLDNQENKPSKGKKDKESNRKKTDKDDSFKKLSKNTKERHYRDKRENKEKEKIKRKNTRSRSPRVRSKSRSQTLSLSRSPSRHRGRNNRHNDRSRQKEKRQEIQRYDVRNVISERQPRTFKDKYGRDTSRPPKSLSRSPSPRRRRSRSISPKFPARKRSRRSLSRRHRSISPRQRRRRSVTRSPIRRVSPPNYVANTRSRSISVREAASPIRHHHHHHRHSERSSSHSRSRSRTKGAKLKKKPDSTKKTKIRIKKKSTNSKKTSPYRSPSAERHVRNRRSTSRSWNREASWNRLSPTQQETNEVSWTPPIVRTGENLTVILKNKDTGSNKRRNEKKKKRSEKRKPGDSQTRKEKRNKQRPDMLLPAQPSKEVFASGDNILVSVSFNKEKATDAPPPQQTTIVTLPPSKDQILSKKTNERERERERERESRRSRRSERAVPRKHKKVDIKPVAIIDLDNSPFKEMTPSPKAVIILSDSDVENDKSSKNKGKLSKSATVIEVDRHEENALTRVASQPLSPATDAASYELSLGPKTPPEPHLVKFSISANTKNKVRGVANPLHDANDDEDDEEEVITSKNAEINVVLEESLNAEKITMSIAQNQQKVGPNTPPESGPCSPDVYDPFEPTKSPSQSPNDNIHSAKSDIQSSSANIDDSNKQQKSVDLVMAFINSKASMEAANSMLSSTLEGEAIENDLSTDDANESTYNDTTINDEPKTSSGIHVVSNILLTTGKDTTTRVTAHQSQSRSNTLTTNVMPISSSKMSVTTNKTSPVKFGSSLITKLPMPSKSTKTGRHNGNDDNMDIESPYSPGSSDYEDLFEPPPMSPPSVSSTALGGPSTSAAATKKHSSRIAATTVSSSISKPISSSQPKETIFDDLFGSTSPINKTLMKNAAAAAAAKRQKHKRSSSIKEWMSVNKQSTQMGYGKLTEEQIRILEDVPGSAVELQVKDKFLRKLNRQERVVEEVKLVLKPYYTKKYITKEDYKEILRRSVPKICHNRTGEINPKKIQKLIEAYVKKFHHHRRKVQATTSK